MLPAVASPERVSASMIRYTVALVVCSLVVTPVAGMGWVYTVAAVVLGAVFLWGTIALGRTPSPSASMRLFSYSISYISVLFLALTVDVFVR